MSDAGKRILRSVRKTRAWARGEVTEGFVVHAPTDVDVRSIRKRLKFSQQKFADSFGFSVGVIRDWEQHRRRPDTSARILLRVIEREPEAVIRALSAE